MKQPLKVKIPFDSSTATMCMCPRCPVQLESNCVSEKMADMTVALSKEPLHHEEIPAVYCAAGAATCRDLDFKQTCICSSCQVWQSYNLASGQITGYYCREGTAR